MNSRTTHRLITIGLSLALCALPATVSATPTDTESVQPTENLKSLGGSFVAFEPDGGGSACWTPSTSQILCFRAESFTDDWEYVENLWMLFPAGWVVSDVVVSGTPSCDSGGIGSFSWSFHTPSYEINIDQQRTMNSTDHCTVTYCVDVTTGAGSGDVLVSWYWAGDDYGSTPHFPCSDDGYTPSGETTCDESTLPQASIPDCSAFGQLQGTISDVFTGGPTCTSASATIEPGSVVAPADGSGDYGPVFLTDGSYDVTASASGFDDTTVPSVSVVSGTITTQDFDLVRPVLDATPASFDVTAPVSTSTDETLALSNLGYVPALDWSISELPPTETANPLSKPSDAATVRVEPELDAQMRSRGVAGYIIDFVERPDLSPALTMDWNARGEYVVDALTETAERTQKRVRTYLDDRRVAYQSFWIDNVITVSSSSLEVFEGLLGFEEIEVLRARRVMGLIEPAAREASTSGGRAVEPNLTQVNVDQVWSLGFEGGGMVVANIDTGARYTHEVLEPHYRGNLGGGVFDHDYNWLSGDGGSATPVDGHGHGTHTMGTMVGDDGGSNQVGMAPGATWIACEGCPNGSCPEASLLTCAQWITAPYPVGDPSSPDPSKRPHVVNNSWGDCGNSVDSWYQASVDSWHAAGIYPVFSNGNASNCGYSSPPGCNTVGNPARYGNVTGVGSTGQANGAYATHSNWGPTDDSDIVNPNGFPSIKPQVAAPGVNIRSSLNGSDSDYASWAGTSMSAPHVSALVVLMWQAAPCLTGDYATTEDILMNTAVAIPYASNCGGEGPGNIPNQATGWGEIDAYAAVVEASAYCNTDWLPWVSESPQSGQIIAGGSEDVTLTFTCDAAPADETGTLRLTSNDPCAETVNIPLALHCESGATSADLAVTKTDGLTTAIPGSGTGYAIVVSNAGPDAATGASVTDTFPAELTGVTWTCSGSGGATCTPAGSGGLADTVNLPASSSVAYSISATIDPGATGTLSNTATVTAPSGVTDPTPGNNSATDVTTLTPQVDLTAAKTDGVFSVPVGDPNTYTITVVNEGPSDAPGASVMDAFPVEVTGVTWSCSGAGGASCTTTGSGDISDTVSLPVGGSVVYTATGTIATSSPSTISNTATVSAPAGVTETDPSDNSATDITDVIVFAELYGYLNDFRCWVPPGDPITYTLEVFNDGPADAMGSLVDTYAWPVTLTGVTWTCTPTGGASCPASGTGDIFTAVDLPAGSSMVFSMTGTVDPAATGWLITTGYVAPDLYVVDPTPNNARWTDWDSLEPPAFCDWFVGGSTGGWTSTVP